MLVPPEPDLSTQALTLQLNLESSWLPPELDEPPFLAALIASPRNQELSRLSRQLEQNAHALRWTFLAWTAQHPARTKSLYCRLMPLAQYESGLAQLSRHREQRRQHVQKLLELLQAALPPALLEANSILPTELPELLGRQTAVAWTPTPAPNWEDFLAMELPPQYLSQRLPLLRDCRKRKALARYRQALQEVQDRTKHPLNPDQAWQTLSNKQILQFRAYYLLPFLPGNKPVKALARKVHAQANPYSLTLLSKNGDTLSRDQSHWIPKP